MGTALPTLAPPATSRQAWARLGLLALTLVTTLGALLLSLAWLWPQPPSRIVEVPLADLEVGVPLRFDPPELGADTRGNATWIWLVRQPDDTVRAFWSRTGHPRDCSVAARLAEHRSTSGSLVSGTLAQFLPSGVESGYVFRTPCLGSTFQLDGTRVFGPAPRGLDSFPTTVEDGTIVLDLSRIIRGTCSGTAVEGCSPPGGPPRIDRHWPGGP
ncbi:MAG: hypothetical protein IT299_07160 [Dehalococcoidia bacterium]|nr:hypothetical protein [Dehalococcoidia bacterium]